MYSISLARAFRFIIYSVFCLICRLKKHNLFLFDYNFVIRSQSESFVYFCADSCCFYFFYLSSLAITAQPCFFLRNNTWKRGIFIFRRFVFCAFFATFLYSFVSNVIFDILFCYILYALAFHYLIMLFYFIIICFVDKIIYLTAFIFFLSLLFSLLTLLWKQPRCNARWTKTPHLCRENSERFNFSATDTIRLQQAICRSYDSIKIYVVLFRLRLHR